MVSWLRVRIHNPKGFEFVAELRLPQGITVLVKLNSGWGILSILLHVFVIIPFSGDQQTKTQITVECAPELCN